MDDSGYLNGPKIKPLLECKTNKTIAMVSNETHRKCSLEGTCKLKDGRVINVFGWIGGDPHKKCFGVLGPDMPFGKGSKNNALIPWVSAASDDLPFGTIVYIKALDGFVVPGTNGKVHNGCLRVDDTGIGVGLRRANIPDARAKRARGCTYLS